MNVAPPTSRIAQIRARRALESQYDELRRTTLAALASRLRGANVRFDPADLEAHYNQAWHALYAKLAGGDVVENTKGFLIQAAFFRAVDDYRKQHDDRRADVTDIDDRVHVDPDIDGALDDAHRLRAFMQGLKGRLNDRGLQAAALCYLHGYTRADAARMIGVSDGQMKKLMDRVSGVVGSLVQDLASGSWCDEQRSLITAYGLGVLDPEGARHELARAHLKDCSSCRAYVRQLRGIAGVVPPLWLPWGSIGLSAGGVGAGVTSNAASTGHASGAPAPPGKPATGTSAAVVAVVAALALVIAGLAGAAILAGDDGEPGRASQQAQAAAGAPMNSAMTAIAQGATAAAAEATSARDEALEARRSRKAARERVARARRASARRQARRTAERSAAVAARAAAAAALPAAAVPRSTTPAPPATPTPPVRTPPARPGTTATTPVQTDGEQEFGAEP